MPKKVLRLLEEARDAATFKNASFGGVHDPAQLDATIKAETRIYRESWILPQLNEVIAWAHGLTTADRIRERL